jgi:hypothetical protein
LDNGIADKNKQIDDLKKQIADLQKGIDQDQKDKQDLINLNYTVPQQINQIKQNIADSQNKCNTDD